MTSRYGSGGGKGKSGLWVGALVVALGACGQVGDLKPPPGQPLPVRPAMATVTPTPEELLTPTTIARPVRIDEIVRRSAPRKPDRFDLPPPSGAEAAPEPEGGRQNSSPEGGRQNSSPEGGRQNSSPEGDSQILPKDSQTRVQEPR